ncbi:MAG: hypothetical protein O2973_14090 [Gemmatimonadetes bacterium]|nr:hypothetical protein [Gemmatimonadota bacterium]
MTASGRDRAIAVAIAAIAMTVMIWPHLGYVPLWDGQVYANCVMDAAFSEISMESLRCAGHPSQGWALPLALTQTFAPGSMAAIHLTNLLLGVVAVAAFRVVLARAFPDGAYARELDLVALACAVHPVVISTLLQPNVDFGVYVYFFIALAGLLTPTIGGLACALVGGTFLAFSKETGVAAYGAAVLAALGAEHIRSGLPLRARFSAIVRRGALLSLPVLLFATYVLHWAANNPGNAIWKHGWQKSSADGFSFFDLSDPIFVSYAAGLGVLGFMWVVWIPVAIDGAKGLARIARRPAPRGAPRGVAGADWPTLVSLTVMTAGLTYVLTSFRTWSNMRYFALLYPLFLLLAYASLHRLGFRPSVRRAVLVLVVGLFVLADYRSVDPLSRAVYGTFDTGVRRMYRMSSLTGEFEGPGRDQLVYNLEFTGYHHVQNALYERLQPTDATVIAAPSHVRWNIWSQLRTTSFVRSLRRDSVFAPIYADEVDVAVRESPEAWFLDFSNRGYADSSLMNLLSQYHVADSIVVVARGQRLVAHHLVRHEAAVLP